MYLGRIAERSRSSRIHASISSNKYPTPLEKKSSIRSKASFSASKTASDEITVSTEDVQDAGSTEQNSREQSPPANVDVMTRISETTEISKKNSKLNQNQSSNADHRMQFSIESTESRVRFEEVDADELSLHEIHDPKSETTLPWWCVTIPWFLVVALSITSAVLTILYTFTFGADKSLAWLRSFIFTMLGEVFVQEPILVLSVALFCAYFVRRDAMERMVVAPHIVRQSTAHPDVLATQKVAVKLLRLDPVYWPPAMVSSYDIYVRSVHIQCTCTPTTYLYLYTLCVL